jgi:hypothetical protein
MGHILLFTSKMTVYHVKKILHFLHTYTVVCQIPQFTKTWFNGEIMKKKRKKERKGIRNKKESKNDSENKNESTLK